MKVNLQLDGTNPRSGFLNLDPFASPEEKLKTQSDICNLDDKIDDAEIDELIVEDVIDFMPANHLPEILDNWIKKIRRGGTIVIGGIDIREVSKGLLSQELTLEGANVLLYGNQNTPYEYRKSTLTMQRILEVLQSRGFKIIHKRISNYYYNVKAERP